MAQRLTAVLISSGVCLSFLVTNTLGIWCIPHLVNCALVETFGVLLEPAKSRNKEARNLTMKVKIVIENLNKSNNMKTGFMDIEEDIMNTSLKLSNDFPQR